MIINDLFTNKKTKVSEGMAGKVVFSGTGANGGKYEIIQSSPTDFMIHANGKHIDTYGSLQRAMNVLKNEVPRLQQGMAEGSLNEFAPSVATGGGKKDYGQPINARYMGGNKFVVGTTNNYILTATIDKYGLDWDDGWYLDSPGAAHLSDASEGEIPLPISTEQRHSIHDTVTDYLNDRNQADLQKVARHFGHGDDGQMNEQGVAEGLPQTLRKVVPGYAKREIDKKMDAEKFGRTDVDRDANYYRYKKIQDKIKEQGMAENQDWMKDLAARAAAKSKPGTPYVPPKQDAEKQQRDLTAKYPNIDELVSDAERNRDPNYDRAEGEAYYRGREAEQQYQRLKQIQRVIQGLNESQADTKKKELGTGTGRINPNTGRPWTPSELKAKYSDVDFDKEARTANLARLRDQAKQERLKDKLKTSLDDPRDSTSNLAKSFVSKGGFGTDFKPPAPVPPSQRTVPPAPAPVTVQGQPPGFTASNLAQQPGMAQYMQQKSITPKPAPNFAQGPTGYKTATTNVPPVATTTTTPPIERNPSDILQALTKMGFKTKEAEAAINRLPPNISTKDAILQILRGKQMSESLTWSKNFDPGRSLYHRIKQES